MEITFEDWCTLLQHIYSLLEFGSNMQWLVIALLAIVLVLLVLMIVVVVKINKISDTTKAIKTNQEILEKELLKKL